MCLFSLPGVSYLISRAQGDSLFISSWCHLLAHISQCHLLPPHRAEWKPLSCWATNPYLLGTPHSQSALKPATFPALLEQRGAGPVCPLIPISRPRPTNEVPLCSVLLNVDPSSLSLWLLFPQTSNLLSGWWRLTYFHLHLSRPKSFCFPKNQILRLKSQTQVEPNCLNVGKTHEERKYQAKK